jgi:hypothetical protein
MRALLSSRRLCCSFLPSDALRSTSALGATRAGRQDSFVTARHALLGSYEIDRLIRERPGERATGPVDPADHDRMRRNAGRSAVPRRPTPPGRGHGAHLARRRARHRPLPAVLSASAVPAIAPTQLAGGQLGGTRGWMHGGGQTTTEPTTAHCDRARTSPASTVGTNDGDDWSSDPDWSANWVHSAAVAGSAADRRCPFPGRPQVWTASGICPMTAAKSAAWPSRKVIGFACRRRKLAARTPGRRGWFCGLRPIWLVRVEPGSVTRLPGDAQAGFG